MIYIKLKHQNKYENQKKLLKNAFEIYSKLIGDNSFGQYKFDSFKIWNTSPITRQNRSNVMYEGNDRIIDECFHLLNQYQNGSIRITFEVIFDEPNWRFDIDLHIERAESRYCDFHIKYIPYILGESMENLLKIPKYLNYFQKTIFNTLLKNQFISKYKISEDIPNTFI